MKLHQCACAAPPCTNTMPGPAALAPVQVVDACALDLHLAVTGAGARARRNHAGASEVSGIERGTVPLGSLAVKTRVRSPEEGLRGRRGRARIRVAAAAPRLSSKLTSSTDASSPPPFPPRLLPAVAQLGADHARRAVVDAAHAERVGEIDRGIEVLHAGHVVREQRSCVRPSQRSQIRRRSSSV